MKIDINYKGKDKELDLGDVEGKIAKIVEVSGEKSAELSKAFQNASEVISKKVNDAINKFIEEDCDNESEGCDCNPETEESESDHEEENKSDETIFTRLLNALNEATDEARGENEDCCYYGPYDDLINDESDIDSSCSWDDDRYYEGSNIHPNNKMGNKCIVINGDVTIHIHGDI